MSTITTLPRIGTYMAAGIVTVPAGDFVTVELTPNLPAAPTLWGWEQLDQNGFQVYAGGMPTKSLLTLHNPGGVDAQVYVWAIDPLYVDRGPFFYLNRVSVPAGSDAVLTYELAETPVAFGIHPLDANGAFTFVSVDPTATQVTLHNPGVSGAEMYFYAWAVPYDLR